ncbi:MAG: FkbM family methyltransferase [Limisphaerales bacterium]
MKNYWSILRNHQRPVRFVAARLLMATGFCRFLTIQQAGFRLRFHPANLSSQLWINPKARDEALVFFRAYVKPGDRVVDVGTNIGDTVLTSALRAGTQGHVVGIEAHPRTFEFLQDNLRLNRVVNVTAIHSAVGASSGTLRFSDDRRDDMNRVDGGQLEVPVARLDNLVTDNLPVNLLKVDVEGYEKFVFEGATEVLKRTDCVFFEVSSLHFARFGYTTRELLELLASAGFRLYRSSGSAALVTITTEFDTEEFENLVALRDDAAFVQRTGWTISA